MTVRRIIACILLPCYLVACTSWKTQEASPQQVLEDEQPDKVRVTLTDGSQVEVYEPALSGDTLIGFEKGSRDWRKTEDTPGGAVSIPLSDVSALEVRKSDGGLTILAVFGGLVLAAGVVIVVGYISLCTGDDAVC